MRIRQNISGTLIHTHSMYACCYKLKTCTHLIYVCPTHTFVDCASESLFWSHFMYTDILVEIRDENERVLTFILFIGICCNTPIFLKSNFIRTCPMRFVKIS